MCEIMAQMGRSDGKLPLEIRKDRVYYDCDDRVTCRSRSGDRKPCPPPLAPRSDALRTLRNNYRQTQVTSNISRRIRGGSLCFKLTTRDSRGVFFFRVAAACMRFRRSAATVACMRGQQFGACLLAYASSNFVPRLIASPPSDFAARIKKPRPKARPLLPCKIAHAIGCSSSFHCACVGTCIEPISYS